MTIKLFLLLALLANPLPNELQGIWSGNVAAPNGTYQFYMEVTAASGGSLTAYVEIYNATCDLIEESIPVQLRTRTRFAVVAPDLAFGATYQADGSIVSDNLHFNSESCGVVKHAAFTAETK